MTTGGYNRLNSEASLGLSWADVPYGIIGIAFCLCRWSIWLMRRTMGFQPD